MEISGLKIDISKMNISGGIPVYLESAYEYYKAEVNGIDFVLMRSVDDMRNVSTIKRHIQLIQTKTGLNVALWVETLSNYRKENLVQNGVPFIINDSQLYLPFIGAIMQKNKSHISYLKEKFVLSAQMLLTLYVNSGKSRLYISEAVNELPFSNMTMTRAVSQLVESGLFKKGKDGVKVFITTDYNAIELFETGKPYFCNPILKVGYVEKNNLTEEAVPAGLSALSTMSMLSDGKTEEYAVDKSYSEKNLVDELCDNDKQSELQIWKYDPLLFSDSNIPDAFSIAVSLADNTDPRVEECIEEMLREKYM